MTIIDETLGRFEANKLNLKISGTLGILLKDKNNGLIKEIKALLYELKEKGIWLSEKLIDKTLTLANEKQ